jgi:hypothetical protein
VLVPHPLHVRVVEPTLLEWTEVEPGCSEPHRWLGGYEHLKRAIELAPDDELARRKLVVLILGRVGFASYELPVGYLAPPMRIWRPSARRRYYCKACQATTTADSLLPRLQRSGD